MSFRDALIPMMFSARIVSLEPSVLVVEATDAGDPNEPKVVLRAQLLISMPVPDSLRVGSTVRFTGVIRGYRQTPLQLIFEVNPESRGKLEW